MRLGLTTAIFARALSAGEVNLGGLADFADEEGFAAVELRDEDASYGLGEVADFVKDTGAKSIEVTYAIKNDMLEPGDEDLLRRGLERAALCGEGAVMRCLASQSALAPPDKKGYTREEISKLADTAVKYSEIAEEKGVFLAIEHAREPLSGDGKTYFGLTDILSALEESGGAPPNFGVTFDPANAVFKALCKAPTSGDKVLEFLGEHSQFIALVHYKTTRGGELMPVITDADVENEALFGELAKVYDGIVCLEIPPAPGLAECHRNIEASLDYIRKLGLMGYFQQL